MNAPSARAPQRPVVRLVLTDGTTIEVYDPRPSSPPPTGAAGPLHVIETTGTVVPMRRAS